MILLLPLHTVVLCIIKLLLGQTSHYFCLSAKLGLSVSDPSFSRLLILVDVLGVSIQAC